MSIDNIKKVVTANVEGIDNLTQRVSMGVNDIDKVDEETIYIGLEVGDETVGILWYVKFIDKSAGINIGHATEKNNATYTTYATAWAAREDLDYGTYSEAF